MSKTLNIFNFKRLPESRNIKTDLQEVPMLRVRDR
jgi:hypothetical protein